MIEKFGQNLRQGCRSKPVYESNSHIGDLEDIKLAVARVRDEQTGHEAYEHAPQQDNGPHHAAVCAGANVLERE